MSTSNLSKRSPTQNPFVDQLPHRFFIDLAIGAKSSEDICKIYGLDPLRVREESGDPLFEQKLLQAKQAVEDTGQAFQARCRAIAHDAIPHVQRLISDPEAPASVRLESFKTLVKLGTLEPKEDKSPAHVGPYLSLTIVAPSGQAIKVGQTLEHTPPTESPSAIPTASPPYISIDDLVWAEG